MAKHRVPRRHAVLVVDNLETVDVHAGEQIIARFLLRDQFAGSGKKGGAVINPRQRVSLVLARFQSAPGVDFSSRFGGILLSADLACTTPPSFPVPFFRPSFMGSFRPFRSSSIVASFPPAAFFPPRAPGFFRWGARVRTAPFFSVYNKNGQKATFFHISGSFFSGWPDRAASNSFSRSTDHS